jgi:Flp pilus assembly protein TadD
MAAILLLAGCSARGRHSAGLPKAPQPTAVALAFDRQVRNAIDAGEGDPFARYLRGKVAADPDNVAARYELAAQYQKQGAFELAVDHLRIAAERQPDSEIAVRKLAEALRGSGQNLEAIGSMVRYCEGHPNVSAELLEELAVEEDRANALGEGERYHRRAIALKPADETLRNNLGYNFLQQAKYEDAAHEFRAALQLNAGSETARNNLGFALAHLGQPQEALLQWSSISGPAAAHNNLAAVWIEQGKHVEARAEIQAALDFDRNHPAAIQNLQLLAELDGKPASFTINPKGARASTGWPRISAAITRLFRGEAQAGRAPQDGERIASQNAKR